MLEEEKDKVLKPKCLKEPFVSETKAKSFTSQKSNSNGENILPKNKRQIIIVAVALSILLLGGLVTMIILLTRPKTFEITSLQIQANDSTIEGEFDVLYSAEAIQFKLVINEDEKCLASKVSWEISGDALDCSINESGLFTIGDTIGSVIVKVTAISKNTVSSEVKVNIVLEEKLKLVDIESVLSSEGLRFIEGQTFNSKGLKISAKFVNENQEDINLFVSDITYDFNKKLAPQDNIQEVHYSYKDVTKSIFVPIVVLSKTLQRLEITSLPKTEYIEGQSLDLSNLEVKAIYEYLVDTVNDFVVRELDKPLSPLDKEFEILYTYNGVTKSIRQAIFVRPKTMQELIVENQPNKLRYIQGQYFKKDGLKVVAKYEYCEKDVTNLLEFDLTDRLCVNDKIIQFTYEENGVKKGGKFDILVEPPYKAVRTITFENPYDATLSWLYEYITDDKVLNIDDTEFENHEILKFDQEKGEYIVPVGSRITLYKVDPSLLGFNINGKDFNFVYPSTTIDFELDFGEEILDIKFNKTLGDKITVRFSNKNIEQNFTFSYNVGFNGPLSENDLAKVAQLFPDNANEYYIYSIGQGKYNFDELGSININDNLVFVVEKQKRESDKFINLNVIYPNMTIKAAVDKTNCFSLKSLPQKERVGYRIDFRLTESGEVLDDDAFIEWLIFANDGDQLYAVYTLTAEEVTGDIVGEFALSDNEKQYSINIVFNSNGTYLYSLKVDREVNCEFSGVYRDNQTGSYTILSVEMDSQYSLISTDDFGIELSSEGLLYTTAFIIDWDELEVEKSSIVLTKTI